MKAPETPEDQKKIKPTAQSNGYKRFFDLGPDKLSVLNSFLITETYSMARIVSILKNEWKVFTNIESDTLRRQLFRYKKDFILPKQAQIATKLTDNHNVAKLAAAMTQIEQNLDVVKEMEWAINLQLTRVKKLDETEKKMPTLMSEQSKNISILTDQLFKLAGLQMDLGVIKKVPTKISLSADLTNEEVSWAENAKLHTAETSVTVQALRYLKEQGVLVVPQSVAEDATIEVEKEEEEDVEEVDKVLEAL